jgi:hypothetical protein
MILMNWTILLALAFYVVLVVYILPRLGVPT